MNRIGTICIVVGHQANKVTETVIQYFPKEVESDKIIFREYHSISGHSGPLVSITHGITQKDKPLLIMLSDVLFKGNFTDMLFNNDFVSYVHVKDWKRWCMVKRGELHRFYDKSDTCPPTDMALSGIYFFKDGNRFDDVTCRIMHDKLTPKNPEISQALALYQGKGHILSLIELPVIDFGTLEAYEENRKNPKSRNFNTIEIYPLTVLKKSETNRVKIIEEVMWFKIMPRELQPYLARIYSDNIQEMKHSSFTGYSMEKIRYPTLREWYLFLESGDEFWSDMFNRLFYVIGEFYGAVNFRKMKPNDVTASHSLETSQFLNQNYLKTVSRCNESPSPYSVHDHTEFLKELKSLKVILHDTLMHGDMCLSNIFYDEKTEQIKLIDPKGVIQGNVLYDYAKLMSCIIYDYDIIDGNLYTVEHDKYKFFNDGKQRIKKIFLEKLEEAFDKQTIYAVTLLCASLFLSMIPLHSENKTHQKLFYDQYRRALQDAHNCL